MPRDDDEIEVEVEILVSTTRAYRVRSADTEVEAWIAKSQILDEGTDSAGKVTSIFVRRWIAEKNELV